jgi:hypothetical protein
MKSSALSHSGWNTLSSQASAVSPAVVRSIALVARKNASTSTIASQNQKLARVSLIGLGGAPTM